jgi:hypothetical protein
MTLRRPLALLPLIALLALTGCGQNSNQTAGDSATTDSLLAASPIETPESGLAPDTAFTPTPETPAQTTPTTPPPAAPKATTPRPKPSTPAPAPGVTVPSGTAMKIAVGTALTSETAQVGDAWTGSVQEAVVVGSAAPFPAGSVVHGVVTGVKPAEKGDRAVLVLKVTSIEANGRTHEIAAAADSIVAGSTRARNVGAVAGGAAAGALIGKAVGGSNKGALIGGLVGGAAATAGVAASKGYQATVKEGAQLTFVVSQDTKIKL